MILYPTQLFAMVREGRMTLQIPEILIRLPGEPSSPPDAPEEVRDEHVTRLNGFLPTQRGGFLYFSRAGFEHYRERLQGEFRSSGRGTWVDFVIAAERSFVDIDREIGRKIANHERAIARLRAMRDGQ